MLRSKTWWSHQRWDDDHLAVFCNLSLKKTQFRKKVIRTRKLRSLDIDSFREDVRNSSLVEEEPIDLDSTVAQYDNGLRLLLDQYVPAKKHLVTIRPFAPWYSPIAATEKQKRRRLQRKWRKTGQRVIGKRISISVALSTSWLVHWNLLNIHH